HVAAVHHRQLEGVLAGGVDEEVRAVVIGVGQLGGRAVGAAHQGPAVAGDQQIRGVVAGGGVQADLGERHRLYVFSGVGDGLARRVGVRVAPAADGPLGTPGEGEQADAGDRAHEGTSKTVV